PVHHPEDLIEVPRRMGDRQGTVEVLVLHVNDEEGTRHRRAPGLVGYGWASAAGAAGLGSGFGFDSPSGASFRGRISSKYLRIAWRWPRGMGSLSRTASEIFWYFW